MSENATRTLRSRIISSETVEVAIKNMMEDKDSIRKRILAVRNAMSDMDCMEKSARILKKLDKTDIFLSAYKVAIYASFANEVITYPLINRAMFLDKGVAFPYIVSEENCEMIFKYVLNISGLKPGKYHILAPEEKAVTMEQPDLIIMPLVAFDENRNRIGYGKGYYDRYLKEHPNCKTIALAYEDQKVEKIPADDNDFRPQMIITEEKIYE